MVELARQATAGQACFDFQTASADALPWSDASVSHILNIESIYYCPIPAAPAEAWVVAGRATRKGGGSSTRRTLRHTSGSMRLSTSPSTLVSAPRSIAMAESVGGLHVRLDKTLDPRPAE